MGIPGTLNLHESLCRGEAVTRTGYSGIMRELWFHPSGARRKTSHSVTPESGRVGRMANRHFCYWIPAFSSSECATWSKRVTDMTGYGTKD